MKILIMSTKNKTSIPQKGPSKGSLKRQELFKKKKRRQAETEKKNDKMKERFF